MGYALFAQRKLVLTSQLNTYQLMQSQRSNEQFALSTRSTSLSQQLTSMSASQSSELADLYSDLSSASGTKKRNSINALISEAQEEFDAELDTLNRQIYEVSIKENAINMEVERLDTQVTAIQEELEAIKDAEGEGITNSTPKFNGVG